MSELYKKWRPKKFKDVVGNETTIAALTGALAKHNLPHTILFPGPSGCGKTTLARILARELQCGEMDFVELNSASYRGIDSIRDIQRNMNLAAAAGPVRVWLMDEAHKLSNDAQSAALKMWEDMPSHVYFFLCTTDPGKLLAAVRTRCTEMPVKLLSEVEIKTVLSRVAKKEDLTFSPDDLNTLAAGSNGSARTALVLLDKCRNLPPANWQTAIAEQQAVENQSIDLCRALIQKKPWKVVADILRNMKAEPEDVRRAVLGYARQVLLSKGDHNAYVVIDCFSRHFYDSGQAGLALAAFEATLGK